MFVRQRRFCFCKNADSQTKDLVLGNLKLRAPPTSIERERAGIRSYGLMRDSKCLTKSTGKFTCAQSAYHFLGYDSSYEVHTVGFGFCIIGSSETSLFDFIFDRLYSFLPPTTKLCMTLAPNARPAIGDDAQRAQTLGAETDVWAQTKMSGRKHLCQGRNKSLTIH